jgi:hypothetical protein
MTEQNKFGQIIGKEVKNWQGAKKPDQKKDHSRQIFYFRTSRSRKTQHSII